jgi:predicted XRE-type DNA-binding protein
MPFMRSHPALSRVCRGPTRYQPFRRGLGFRMVKFVEMRVKEIGAEGFTFELASNKSGTVHVEQILEYNRDPGYLRDQLVYKLTLEAQRRVAESRLSKREIIRRLGTSATQFYRLLDQTNYSKSVDQLVSLLQVLDYEVDLRVRAKTA